MPSQAVQFLAAIGDRSESARHFARLRYVVKHESAGNTFDFIDGDDGQTKPWTFVVMHNTADALEKMTAGA
jgi:hypothetical protein